MNWDDRSNHVKLESSHSWTIFTIMHRLSYPAIWVLYLLLYSFLHNFYKIRLCIANFMNCYFIFLKFLFAIMTILNRQCILSAPSWRWLDSVQLTTLLWPFLHLEIYYKTAMEGMKREQRNNINEANWRTNIV